MAKFNKWQKCVEFLMLLIILLTGIYKISHPKGDVGVAVILIFVSLLVFLILSCAALFPATWRMTDEEKRKIPDLQKYQEKYTGIFVIVNAIISCILVLVIVLIG